MPEEIPEDAKAKFWSLFNTHAKTAMMAPNQVVAQIAYSDAANILYENTIARWDKVPSLYHMLAEKSMQARNVYWSDSRPRSERELEATQIGEQHSVSAGTERKRRWGIF